ncbi:sensor histidine kinase [Paenibacillus xylanexedens]|uniref:sensor histidine kinase n=1 Tax=Paenibacillus xylanexedens TaxID=528191 RepID=UPI0011A5D6C6|nr:histidine kinase [Paenibacillus xylanexedens]
MSYKQIKWMILLIPTLTVGVWEYVRHQFLLPYISMDLGNWLTPVMVYVVSITLVKKLFRNMERIQKELEQERAAKAVLESREKLAKELHDGIAQSLFLLSVQVERLESKRKQEKHLDEVYAIRKTVHEVNRYVRQSIANLRYDSQSQTASPTLDSVSLRNQIGRMIGDTPIPINLEWDIKDEDFTAKEKIELLACMREAVVNIQKHAKASEGWIMGENKNGYRLITIKDNGRGFAGDPFAMKDRYGLHIMKERLKAMNWNLKLYREQEYTVVQFSQDGEHV